MSMNILKNPQETVIAETLLMFWPPVRTQKYLWTQFAAAEKHFWTSSKDYPKQAYFRCVQREH